ncbi:MAG: protein phosphatase [Boseongicola sp.]|nr:protein phosphatase [Boseongicola sp.]
MVSYSVSELRLGRGWLGISPIPGRTADYSVEFASLLTWEPTLVLTMTTMREMIRVGAEDFGADLEAAGVMWRHLPIADFGAPQDETNALWPEFSKLAHNELDNGGRVLAHCYGGCGRSGMALMRLMVEAGEEAEPALARLRDVRACAVEAEEQRAWAAIPMFDRLGWSQ